MKLHEIAAVERRLVKKSIAILEHPMESAKLAMTAPRTPKRTRQPSHIKIDSTSNGSE